MDQNVTLLAAFAAGFLSFISPCVLPLIPGYISFVSGVSVDEMRTDTAPTTSRLQIFLTSLAFVIGFSLVFVALGASATAIGKFLFARLPLFSKIAGAVLIVFGLHTMGVFRLAFLDAEKRVHSQRKPAGPLDALHRADPRRYPGDRGLEELGDRRCDAPGRLLSRPRHSIPAHVAGDQP